MTFSSDLNENDFMSCILLTKQRKSSDLCGLMTEMSLEKGLFIVLMCGSRRFQ